MTVATSELPSSVPASRVRNLNDRTVRSDGSYVLYWMTAYRRTESNYALQRAAEWSRYLRLPLVVLSAVRLDYRWASERTHAFILDSMADVDLALAETAAVSIQYVEPSTGGGKGLLAALASNAAVVVGDDAPVFFLPAMTAAAADRIPVLMEGVDHNGLLPLAATDQIFLRAYDFRRFVQRELPSHITDGPADGVLNDLPAAAPDLVSDVLARWHSLPADRNLVGELALDHDVPATPLRGGEIAGRQVLDDFVTQSLSRYEERNHPDAEATSGLSPYLHFGNVSPHQVFNAIAAAESWNPGNLAEHSSGARSGWWGMGSAAEGFLDQVVTWRELGYRAARLVPDNETYSALPSWARASLAEHADDPREYIYTHEQLDSAETHDDIWNAAQRQLRHDGIIHNYLRMLWGKKILEWTRSPEEAHDIMFALNDRYALDGRDPNSVSGIHWVLGRYDRPWGPERPIFGKVRYMSSDSTRRKLKMAGYLGQSKMLNT